MSELLSEETRLAIQHLIIKCANDAKQQADNFAKNETSIGKQHPKGLSTHITEVIFEQKKELKKGSSLGSAWINSNCPEVFTNDVISHIIELATDYFIKEKENDIYHFNKGHYKEISDDGKHLKDLEEYYLAPFFKGIRRVYALEDVIKDKGVIHRNREDFVYNLDVHPLVPIKILSDFHKFCILKELFATRISEFDFIECFKDNIATPSNYPAFKVKNQFIYFLSKFDTINSKIANSNFGIKNYTNDKSELKRAKPRPEITLKIDKIVKQVV
ncbi:MAG: hypothetical protein H7202_11285 [Pedobacter sp.]|nr:hypothetical protein [Pedobacter sp.]